MSTQTRSRNVVMAPNGHDELAVRERWLKSRQRRREITDRGLIAVWVLLGALAAWLFIAAFAGFAGLGR